MKKQLKKLTLKTDQIISLSKNAAQAIRGGQPTTTVLPSLKTSC